MSFFRPMRLKGRLNKSMLPDETKNLFFLQLDTLSSVSFLTTSSRGQSPWRTWACQKRTPTTVLDNLSQKRFERSHVQLCKRPKKRPTIVLISQTCLRKEYSRTCTELFKNQMVEVLDVFQHSDGVVRSTKIQTSSRIFDPLWRSYLFWRLLLERKQGRRCWRQWLKN